MHIKWNRRNSSKSVERQVTRQQHGHENGEIQNTETNEIQAGKTERPSKKARRGIRKATKKAVAEFKEDGQNHVMEISVPDNEFNSDEESAIVSFNPRTRDENNNAMVGNFPGTSKNSKNININEEKDGLDSSQSEQDDESSSSESEDDRSTQSESKGEIKSDGEGLILDQDNIEA